MYFLLVEMIANWMMEITYRNAKKRWMQSRLWKKINGRKERAYSQGAPPGEALLPAFVRRLGGSLNWSILETPRGIVPLFPVSPVGGNESVKNIYLYAIDPLAPGRGRDSGCHRTGFTSSSPPRRFLPCSFSRRQVPRLFRACFYLRERAKPVVHAWKGASLIEF